MLEIIHPRAASRRGPETVKLYTESLWAAGRALMKDSETVGRITNARLRHTHTHTHTHTRTCRDAMQANTHAVTLQSRLEGPMGVGWRDG